MFSFNHIGNHGHLGNQMFQYAATKGLARKHNRDFMIAPNEVFGKYYYTTLRSNLDDCFDLKCQRGISNFPTHEERHYHFDEETFENPPKEDTNLLGFFQSDKWFKHIDDEIREDFTFKPEIYDVAKNIRDSFSEETTSIHIRRTDYVTNGNHVSQDMDYYDEALKLVPDNTNVLIFSDEPEWCKHQSVFSGDRFLVSEVNDPYIDLCLMTLCDYHIMANSTFSWWAAYLAKTKLAIAPKVWLPDSTHNTKDVYCADWVKI